MHVRIVRAASKEQALADAKAVMNGDPLILSVRRATDEDGQGEWEVVVAQDPQDVDTELAAVESDDSQGSSIISDLDSCFVKIRRLLAKESVGSKELNSIAYYLAELEQRTNYWANGQETTISVSSTLDQLTKAGYPKEQARQLVSCWVDGGEFDIENEQDEQAAIVDLFAQEIPVAPTEERVSPGIVLFSGPSGVGKTALATKLAADLCLGGATVPKLAVVYPKKGLGLEMMRKCASTLGISLLEIRTPEELLQLKEGSAQQTCIIDTPAINPMQISSLESIREVVECIPDAELHVVIPASYSDDDFDLVLNTYAWSNQRRLSVTHLDESPFIGRAVAAASRAKVPIGYLSLGTRIPDDLSRPSKRLLASSVLSGEGGALSL